MVSDAAYSGRWARLVPIAFITYSLAYVDRANYAGATESGSTGTWTPRSQSSLHVSEMRR